MKLWKIIYQSVQTTIKLANNASLGREDFFRRINEKAQKRWTSLLEYGMETREFRPADFGYDPVLLSGTSHVVESNPVYAGNRRILQPDDPPALVQRIAKPGETALNKKSQIWMVKHI